MGRDISKLYKAAKWGSAFFDCLSLDLKTAFPAQPGFSVTNIKYAKRWYEFYNQDNIIRQQVVDEFEMPIDFGMIPWGHHIEIFTRSKSVSEALFYIDETIRNSWSRAELAAEIEDNLYATIAMSLALILFSTVVVIPKKFFLFSGKPSTVTNLALLSFHFRACWRI